MRGLKRNNDGHLAANQFVNQRWQSIVLTLSPPVLNHDIPALDVTGVCQAFMKSGEILAGLFEGGEVKKPE
jgi:hypothetical protein